MRITVRLPLFVFALATLLAAVNVQVPFAQARTAVFTEAQAAAGKTHYATSCAACHGADLGGADAPALAGPDFIKAWGGQTTADLFNYVQGMPPGGTPLPADDNLTVVAFILHQNGATAGAAPLVATTAEKISGVATGTRPPPVAFAPRH